MVCTSLRVMLRQLGVLVFGEVVHEKRMHGAIVGDITPLFCTMAPTHSAQIVFHASWSEQAPPALLFCILASSSRLRGPTFESCSPRRIL
jgi:hypothetical protein